MGRFAVASVRRLSIARLTLVLLALGVALTFGAAGGRAAGKDAPPPPATRDHGHGAWFRHVCSLPDGADAGCEAQVVTSAAGDPLASTTPPPGAYGPDQFHIGYSLPTTAPGEPPTIAIVDAFDDPKIEADLAIYNTKYNLPPCTTANGCFRKVNQNGGTAYPAGNSWHLEIALDVETAHQICQNCKILLVEATNNSLANLGAAVNTAAALGANVISNSYGAGEYAGQTADESAYYNHPGIVITVSAGDSGYGVEFPAASQYVTAVGGTTLSLNPDKTYNSETVWSGTGSGCSLYEPKPAWQTDTGCSRRTVADVSADADPNTGAAIYDSVGAAGGRAWYQFGGTSLSAPLIAAVYALTGNTNVTYGSTPYSHAASLHDVTAGSNGSCSPPYLCTAVQGFDAPSGLGTPNGLLAFGGASPVPDFSLTVTPSSTTVTAGQAASYTVGVTASGGFSGGVTLAASGLPDLATATFNPATTTTASTLTVTTAGLLPGTYPFTIGGTGGGLSHTTAATLVVQAAVTGPTVAVTPSAAARGTAVTVGWSNVAGPTSYDLIGLYQHGGTARLNWFYTSSCSQRAQKKNAPSSGSCTFKLPNTPGTYEFRLFAQNGSTPLATSNTVTAT
jgi:hypothetical protein